MHTDQSSYNEPIVSHDVLKKLQQLLQRHGVPFDVTRHEPVYTSEEAAAVRGTSLTSGAKALICKADQSFVLIVIPANLRLASKIIRKERSIRSFRFARREEVQELTGLTPGAIPPFGSLFGLPTWCDQRLGDDQYINFNAGDHAVSISMTFDDYVAVEQPQIGHFTEI